MMFRRTLGPGAPLVLSMSIGAELVMTGPMRALCWWDGCIDASTIVVSRGMRPCVSTGSMSVSSSAKGNAPGMSVIVGKCEQGD